jgi:DNA-binding response OmpR family regulator
MDKILVIAGDKLTRWSLGEAFRQEGFEVSEAATWEEALALARTVEFRLILADFEIQDEQGLSRLKEVQDLQASAAILILSSDPRDQMESVLRPLGRFCLIEKPYGLAGIKSAAREALGDRFRGGERS